MSEKVKKHFRVLTRSHINNAVQEPGSIVSLDVDPDTWSKPAHLEEIEGYEPKHTEAQQKEADAEAERTAERLARQEEREAETEDEAPVEPPGAVPGAPPADPNAGVAPSGEPPASVAP